MFPLIIEFSFLQVLYAPKPDRIPRSDLPMPKISRLSTVTTVLENLRKFTNYTIQVKHLPELP